MVKAREIMDEPDFIHKDASVEEVIEEVKGVENTLIVLDEDEKAVGEIRESSLISILIPEEKVDEEKVIGIIGFSFDSSYVAENAEDLMKEHEIRVDPDEDIGDIAFIMEKEDLRAVPVEEEGEIIGVVHQNKMIEQIE